MTGEVIHNFYLECFESQTPPPSSRQPLHGPAGSPNRQLSSSYLLNIGSFLRIESDKNTPKNEIEEEAFMKLISHQKEYGNFHNFKSELLYKLLNLTENFDSFVNFMNRR